MSVVSHLAVSPAGYDRRIRQLIPHYDELLNEAGRALRLARRPVRGIIDLGIGTGALSAACLTRLPGARVLGIDADPAMMRVATTRLRRWRGRVRFLTGDFLRMKSALPRCDAIVASYALHHIPTRRAKLAFYRRCWKALRPGGVLISGDCAPAGTARAVAPLAVCRDGGRQTTVVTTSRCCQMCSTAPPAITPVIAPISTYATIIATKLTSM